MLKTILFLFALGATLTFAADLAYTPSPTRTETQIWDLEKAYWEYVKTNDLEKYRTLWHDHFVGWPFVSAAPVRKDHITDWITNNTSKGLKLQSYDIQQLAIQVTGDVAIDHYRAKLSWAKSDTGEMVRTDATRITHTWIRTNGTWQIVGGMSAPVDAEGK